MGRRGTWCPRWRSLTSCPRRGHEVAFCGTERGMEKDLVPRAGYPFSVVRIRGFQRRLGVSTLQHPGLDPAGGRGRLEAAARLPARLRGGRGRVRFGAGGGRGGRSAASRRWRWRWTRTWAGPTASSAGWSTGSACRFPTPERTGGKYVYTGRPLRPALLAATREEGLARFNLDPGPAGAAGLRRQPGSPHAQRGRPGGVRPARRRPSRSCT